MKEIPLSKGKITIVDDLDYEWLSQWKWCVSNKGYAQRNTPKADGRVTTIRMHSQIVGIKPGFQADHINGDRLDNRRSNLRHATCAQNSENREKVRGNSQFKGVGQRKDTQKWRAIIQKGATVHYIGQFSTEVEAALAYNKVAISLFGEFARLNVVEQQEDTK